VRPASVEVETPMFAAPPSKKRPDWNAATTVEPWAKESGSTCVRCCPVGVR